MCKFRLYGLAVMALALAYSCEREIDISSPAPGEEMTITAGFEDPGTNTKTFVYNGSQIRWGSTAADKVIHVFDTKGAKNAFNSTTVSSGSRRSFAGSISQGSEIKLILWSGKTAEEDQTVLDGSNILSGSTLAVVNPQQIQNTNSFANNANIAVMRPGDESFKSVFGYIRYTVPAWTDGSATIKSITITADEDLAGQVDIDCSGSEPIASIVSNGSKSLTVNTGWTTKSGGYYEPGTLFAVLPAGTYHNMKVTIIPFADSSCSKEAETGNPIVISCKGDVVIKRGCFSNLGTLPYISRPAEESALFASDFFTRVIDDSGVTSYLVRNEVLPRSNNKLWSNSQSVYFIGNEMTNDERFLIVMVTEDEFSPSYHLPQRNARILDLQKRKIYNFYADSGCYPWLDPETDQLYYCRWSGTSAKLYRRDLLVDPSNEIYLTDFPQALLPTNGGRALRRAISHLTLTSDRQSVFIDTWIDDDFYWGLLNLYTGAWDEWGHSTTSNVTHGQINPKHDDEALCAIDSWKDSKGVQHNVGTDSNGYYRRMQFVKKGSMETIQPNPENNNATHEGWTADGDHVYFCSSGINIRNIRTGEWRWVLKTKYGTDAATHCNPSSDLKYWTFDDNSPDYYRGCRWKVNFYNDVTGKRLFIHSNLPAIATSSQPSQIHPDPHPHFVCNDKYIICSAAGNDKFLHLSITPVDQLITLTQ